MNWNLINTILLAIICFVVSTSFLFDFSINTDKKASISEIATIIIYLATFAVAVWALVVNRKMAKAQTEPFIDIKLDTLPSAINVVRLKISNLGTTSAFNITFSIIDIKNPNSSSKRVIEALTAVNFMENKLSYLSKGDSRYSSLVNLYRDDSSRGFTNKEFFDTEFTVRIRFEDINKTKYKSEFVLVMNELMDKYEVGKTFEDKLIKQIEGLNTKLNLINKAQEAFRSEYEKTHRDWTEQELKLKLHHLEKTRNIRKSLGLPPEKNKKISKKMSIQQIRKEMKK